MMGSGKTTVGRAVAERLGIGFLDIDAEVERVTGQTVAQLFSAGEPEFRRRESAMVAEVAALAPPLVVAAGGGCVVDPQNREAMRRSGVVVWLRADPEELAARIGPDPRRPLLAGEPPAERLARLLEERVDAYGDSANAQVETTGRGLDEVVDEVVRCLTGS
jgi:shikimate kinase